MSQFLPSRHRQRIVIAHWQDAEELAEWHMRRLGFTDATMTGPGTDQGLDVIAADAVAQVKHHNTPVGAPDVQRLVGAAQATRQHRLFYSLSGFTRHAMAYADDAGVILFGYTIYGTLTAANSHAQQALTDGGIHPEPSPDEPDPDVDVSEPTHLGQLIERRGPLTTAEQHDLLVFVVRTASDTLLPHARSAGDLHGDHTSEPNLGRLWARHRDGVQALADEVVAALADTVDRTWPAWFTLLEDWLERSRRLQLLEVALEEADRWDDVAAVEARYLPRCQNGEDLLWHWWQNREGETIVALGYAHESLSLLSYASCPAVFPTEADLERLASLVEHVEDSPGYSDSSEFAFPLTEDSVGLHLELWLLRAIIDARPFGLSHRQVVDVLDESMSSQSYVAGTHRAHL